MNNLTTKKLKYYLVGILCVFSTGISAQHFDFLPDRELTITVPASGYSNPTIYMENLTGGELVLAWENISLEFPEEWQADLCDYVSCYVGIPAMGEMFPIVDTLQGYLRITLNPNDHVGTGTAVFKVFDNKHPEVADTCTFIIHTEAVTTASQHIAAPSFKVYPQPASETLYIHSNYLHPVDFRILDLQGRTLWENNGVNQEITKINLHEFARGAYLVIVTNEKEILERKKILIH